VITFLGEEFVILNREHYEQYERDGYLIFDPEVPSTLLDGIIADMNDKYNSSEHIDVTYRDPGRIQDAWKISSNVKALALAPKVLDLLEELYNRKPLAFQTLNFPRGTQQPAHSDTIHFNSKPSGCMSGVWVALEDIDMENGPLVYYPGSHKLPEITLEDIEKEGLLVLSDYDGLSAMDFHQQVYPHYERFISDMIKLHDFNPYYATINKGLAIIWAANLLHGGAPQHHKNRTRHSQATHYFFPGCRYYMPLHSKGEKICWMNPTWINKDDLKEDTQNSLKKILKRILRPFNK